MADRGLATCHFLDIRDIDERARAAAWRLVPVSYRRRFLTCQDEAEAFRRLGSGILLSHVLGVHDDAQLERSPSGKPRLAENRSIHFNLSHAGRLVVLATFERPIGVDTEPLEAEEDPLLQLALRKIYPAQALREATERSSGEFPLLSLWTEAEAALKARGCGFEGLDDGMDTRSALQGMHVHTAAIDHHLVSCASEADFDVEFRRAIP